jgi:hypothetical protein
MLQSEAERGVGNDQAPNVEGESVVARYQTLKEESAAYVERTSGRARQGGGRPSGFRRPDEASEVGGEDRPDESGKSAVAPSNGVAICLETAENLSQ